MTQTNAAGKVSLVRELGRVLHGKDRAILCAMSHSQITVSGHVVKPEHDRCWTEEQLAGRTAKLYGREAPLFTTQLKLGHDGYI